MVNRMFGRAKGTLYKLNWIPLIYYVAFEHTIFNWAYIISDSLPSYVAATQGGITQRRLEFYMSSYMIDCILCRNPFSKLGCIWTWTETPLSVVYQILWAHRYAGFYKLICEEFLIALYELIFLKEPNCLFDDAMDAICEYGDYFFSQEGTYLRMYGGSKAP